MYCKFESILMHVYMTMYVTVCMYINYEYVYNYKHVLHMYMYVIYAHVQVCM